MPADPKPARTAYQPGATNSRSLPAGRTARAAAALKEEW